jgi:hypothetical protein
MTIKPSNTNSIAKHPRCSHRFANGMRCSVPAPKPDVPFCPRHARLAQNEPIEQDLAEHILKDSQDFQTAQGVNYSLASIFELLAQNRISARRAAVLAYIGSLLLRTHACIDREQSLNAEDSSIHIDFGDLPRPNRNPHVTQEDTKTNRATASAPELDPTKKPS